LNQSTIHCNLVQYRKWSVVHCTTHFNKMFYSVNKNIQLFTCTLLYLVTAVWYCLLHLYSVMQYWAVNFSNSKDCTMFLLLQVIKKIMGYQYWKQLNISPQIIEFRFLLKGYIYDIWKWFFPFWVKQTIMNLDSFS